MKKRNLFAAALLIAAAAIWSFVSCGSSEKNTERTQQADQPTVQTGAAETDECALTVYLLAAASFTNNPVITGVDFNGSSPGNPPLKVGEKVPIAGPGIPAAYGIFVGVKDGKPVTVKVETDDGQTAVLTIPCDTQKTTIVYPSNKYSVVPHPMDHNAIQFNFQPKQDAAVHNIVTLTLEETETVVEAAFQHYLNQDPNSFEITINGKVVEFVVTLRNNRFDCGTPGFNMSNNNIDHLAQWVPGHIKTVNSTGRLLPCKQVGPNAWHVNVMLDQNVVVKFNFNVFLTGPCSE